MIKNIITDITATLHNAGFAQESEDQVLQAYEARLVIISYMDKGDTQLGAVIIVEWLNNWGKNSSYSFVLTPIDTERVGESHLTGVVSKARYLIAGAQAGGLDDKAVRIFHEALDSIESECLYMLTRENPSRNG